MRRIWGWRRPVGGAGRAAAVRSSTVLFLASNSLKVPDGGWFPLLIGVVVFTLLTTWKRGRALLMERLAEDSMPLDIFIESIGASPPPRVPGTAVFLTSTADRVPHALLHNLKHNKVLHDRVVFLTIHTQDFPRVPAAERVRISELGCAFWRMDAYYGFAEDPDVPELLEADRQGRIRVRHDGDVVLRLPRDADRERWRRAWRSGASGCSCRCRRWPSRRPTSSTSRPIASSSSARRSSCSDAGRRAAGAAGHRPSPAKHAGRHARRLALWQVGRVRARPSAPASTSAPCPRSGGCARPTRRTRRRAPAASRGRSRRASAPR